MNTSTTTQATRTIAALCLLAVGAATASCSSGAAVGAAGPDAQGPGSAGSQGGRAGRALSSCASYGGTKSCHYVTVSASGARAFHGTDVVPNPQTCTAVLAADASANGGEVQLSAPVFLSGPAAAFNLFLNNYHGPGTYSQRGNDANITFLIGSTEYISNGPSSAVTAVAGPDGSVSVTFSKLASGSDPSRTISGTARFTCKNA